MSVTDQPLDSDQPSEQDEPVAGNPKSFVSGFMHGLREFMKTLEEHGSHQYSDISDIYEHCCDHYDELLKWQNNSSDSETPPPLPPFVKS